jgi:hypothetical protein
MQAIEFESQLSRGAIPVPESLHLIDGRRVRVLLLLEESEDRAVEFHDAIADLLDNPMVLDDFQPLTREQVHER